MTIKRRALWHAQLTRAVCSVAYKNQNFAVTFTASVISHVTGEPLPQCAQPSRPPLLTPGWVCAKMLPLPHTRCKSFQFDIHQVLLYATPLIQFLTPSWLPLYLVSHVWLVTPLLPLLLSWLQPSATQTKLWLTSLNQ